MHLFIPRFIRGEFTSRPSRGGASPRGQVGANSALGFTLSMLAAIALLLLFLGLV